MGCEEARQALWPEPGPRPATPQIADAFAHYEQCATCQQFFATQRALTERLRRLARTEAPRALRARVERAIAQEVAAPPKPRRAFPWVAGGGLMVAAAAALVLMMGTPEIPDRVMQPLVERAAEGLQVQPADTSGLFTTTSDPRQLHAWFQTRVSYPVDIPQIDDAELLGGRVVELGDAHVAAIVYMYHDHPVTYFPLASGEVMGSQVDWNKIVAQTTDGYELAVWQEGGLARAVVAAMPRSEVVRFAKECRAKALRTT